MVIMLTVIVFGGMTVQMLEAALGIRMGVEDNKVSSSNKDDSRSAGAGTRSAAGGQDTLTTISGFFMSQQVQGLWHPAFGTASFTGD